MNEQVDLIDLTILSICSRATPPSAIASSYQLLRDGARPDLLQRVERLCAIQLLTPVGPLERLTELTTDQLKDALREQGLSLTGHKPRLVERLRESITEEDARSLVGGGEPVQVTPRGAALLEDTLKMEQRLHRKAVSESLEHMRRLEISEAWQSRVDFLSRRGGEFGIAPTGYPTVGPMRRYGELRELCRVWPNSLHYLSLDMRTELRAAVAVSLIWGEAAEVFLPDNFPTSPLPARIAAAHLASAARIAREVAAFGRGSVTLREEKWSTTGACTLCIELIGKSYTDKTAIPALPLQACTSEAGCGLRVAPIFPTPEQAEPQSESSGPRPLSPGAKPLTPTQRVVEARALADAKLITESEYEQVRTSVLGDLIGSRAETGE